MDILKKVCDYVDAHELDIATTLSEVIQIDSCNHGAYEPGNESKVQEYVIKKMQDLGMETWTCAFDPDKARPNVCGVLSGTGGGKTIMLDSHSDVVPVGDEANWKYPPRSGLIKDGCVHGRGASDNKNGIATMLWAVKALQDCGVKLKGDIQLLSAVGEETCEGDRHGAGPACLTFPKKADVALVCEATHLSMEIASSNLTFFEVTVPGKAAHMCARNQVLFPQAYGVMCGNEIGVDAFEKALPIIQALQRLELDWSRNVRHPVWGSGGRGGKDLSGVGCNIINLAKIQGGDYELAVMGSVKLTYGVLCAPQLSLEQAQKEILDCINKVASMDSWLRENPPIVKMPVITLFPAYDTPMDHPGVAACAKALKEACGIDAIMSGQRATVDASWLHANGIPCITIGAGGADTGPHGDNEYVEIAELKECVKAYAATIMNFCELAD